MEKKDYIILVDMDDTIENLLGTWVKYLNKQFGFNVDYNNITDWDMRKTFPTLEDEQIYAPLVDPNLWQEVKPFPGAVETLRKLVEEGFTVRICTASSPTSYALKMRYFVKKYLPFLDTRLHCICVHDKQLVKGNVLADDNINNLSNGSYTGLLFTRPHNLKYDYPKELRVANWDEIYDWIEKDFANRK